MPEELRLLEDRHDGDYDTYRQATILVPVGNGRHTLACTTDYDLSGALVRALLG